jgi:hypothetical protein
MNGDNKTAVAVPPVARLQEQESEHRTAVSQANATPLPGVLKDVFAIVPDITVGQFKVRPLCDYDFEILQALDNPIFKLTFDGQEYGNNPKDLRGKAAWQACYLLTNSIDDVEKVMAIGVAEFDLVARKEFSRLKLFELFSLMKAVLQQLQIYWSPRMGYELAQPEPEDGQTVEVKKKSSDEVQTC